MQLDNTRLAVRERGMIDTLDLTLHVISAFAARLVPALLLGILPFAIFNEAITYWMWEEPQAVDPLREDDVAMAFLMVPLMQSTDMTRYNWANLVLIFFEAPAATIFAMSYLGGAVFKHEKTLKETVQDVFSMWSPLLVCQWLLRGTLIVCAIPIAAYVVSPLEVNSLLEVVAPILLFLWVAGLRAFRPYINEIIVLERNPLRSKSGAMTVGKRSGFLHGSSGGDLLGQWLGACIVAFLLMHVLFWSMWCVYLVMFGDYNLQGWVPQHILRPVALWLVVAIMGVARFLMYLDLRIRQEGWEVELLIKAEAARLAEKLV